MNFIYALRDPDTDEIRYVGVTCKPLRDRLSNHVHDAARGVNDSHTGRWIRNLLAKSKRPKITLLEETEDRNREIFWISSGREYGLRLTNATDGGEGATGYKHSESIKALISARQIGHVVGNSTREKLSSALRGIPLSQERKDHLKRHT